MGLEREPLGLCPPGILVETAVSEMAFFTPKEVQKVGLGERTNGLRLTRRELGQTALRKTTFSAPKGDQMRWLRLPRSLGRSFEPKGREIRYLVLRT